MEDICDFGKTSKGNDTASRNLNTTNIKKWKTIVSIGRVEDAGERSVKFFTSLGNCVISFPYPEHYHFSDGNGIEARVVAAIHWNRSKLATPLAVIGSESKICSVETIEITKETKSSMDPTNSYEEFGCPSSFTKLYFSREMRFIFILWSVVI